MTDALCGPSNAIQNFQKHTAIDRTLQQDRLVNRQPSAQGFRSQNSNAGILDAEFEAFEHTFTGPPVSGVAHPGVFAAPNHVQSHPLFPNADAGDWATDFQRLQVSGPPSSSGLLQENRSGPLLSRAAPGGWQDDFFRHQQQGHQNASQQSPHASHLQPSFRPNFQMSGGLVSPAGQQLGQLQTQPALETQSFDESAFEAAFAQAKAEIEQQQADNVTHHDVTEAERTQTEPQPQTEATETIRIGSDLILDSTNADLQERREDSDELSRTAAQLLDSVGHDQSQKFKESSFLALMRRIRDREVHIEGDEFRETSQSLHPGGPYYPGVHTPPLGTVPETDGGRLSAADMDKFDHVEESGSLHVRFGSNRHPNMP